MSTGSMLSLLALTGLMSPSVAQLMSQTPPVIDVHLHALPANLAGKPPVRACGPYQGMEGTRGLECFRTVESPLTDSALMTRTLALMKRYNIIGVTSGAIDFVRRWKAAAPDRIIASAAEDEPLASIRKWAASGNIQALGEMSFQYLGLAPNDSIPESYFALAEQLDLPIGVHVGMGPPGAPYIPGMSAYRMRLSNPLLLEDALVRHPKMRLYVMHAGWPMLDEMIGLLYAYPQVYVDVGWIDWFVPQAEFYTYLRRLVEAGFGKRIMFGSDEVIWPEAIPVSINAIETAPFLSAGQKRDILYNNAARFLRLDVQRRATAP